MSYEPFIFKIYIATSTHDMEQWIEAAEDAVDEYNSKQKLFRFDVEGCHNASNAFNLGKKQDTYNKMVEKSHILIALIGDEAGPYTVEEFWAGYKAFQKTGFYPHCCAYIIKKNPLSKSVSAFLEQIKQKDQYWKRIRSPEDVKHLLFQEMNKVVQNYNEHIAELKEGTAFDCPITSEEQENICRWYDKSSLQGTWKNGFPAGQAVFTRMDGKKFEGVFSAETERIYDNGVFTGYFCNHPPVGKGYLITKDGKYFGEVRGEILPDGYGSSVQPDGSKCVGYWENGHLEGMGLYISPQESLYEGMFHDGIPKGHGIYTFADKATADCSEWTYVNRMRIDNFQTFYSGMAYLEKGLLGIKTIPCGQGTIQWEDTDESYYGEVREFQPNGYGVYTFRLGSTFSGMWKDGSIKNDSQGVYQFEHNKQKVSGIWQCVSYLKISHPEHPGDCFYYSGTLYKDNKNDWIITGDGILYDSKKRKKYRGEFLDGSFHGYGAVFNEKAEICESGIWEYGELIRTDS